VLPFLGSSVALVADGWFRRGERGPALPESAASWLQRRIVDLGLPLRVEVHPRGGFDAYWPSVAAIGLSEATAAGTSPADWAVAAHELGHARTVAGRGLLAQLFAVARSLAGLAWRAFVAALLVAAAFGEPWLLRVAFVFLSVAVAAQIVVVADESAASLGAFRSLSADPRLSSDARRAAGRALLGAFGVYLAALLAELTVAIGWPLLARVAIEDAAHLGPWPPPAAAVWVSVALLPLLVLRAMQVLSQVLFPEEVATELQLLTRMRRDREWELMTAVAVAILLATAAGSGQGPVFALAVAFAVTTLVAPTAGLVRGALALPARLAMRWWRGADRRDRLRLLGRPPPEEGSALLAVYSRPPWTVRLTWLADLAYVPFLLVLFLDLLR
jgi:Zn-dependent membrane protease YugP